MTIRLDTSALMVSAVLWGTLLGGIAYSHLVYFPVFLSALPDSAAVVTGPFGLHEEVFWMSIHPAMLVSLVATLALNWKSRRRRVLIGATATVYAVVLLATQFYFIPELIAFAASQSSALPASEWLTRAQRWETLSWIRGAISYLAFLPLLLALTHSERDATSAPPR